MRRPRWCSAVGIPLALAVLLTACTQQEDPPAPTPSQPQASGSSEVPADCTTTATSSDAVTQALATAQAGTRICVTGSGLADADLGVGTSGAPDRPVTLVGEGSTPVRSITVTADHVVVEGFAAVDGEGIELAGTGLTVRGNQVERAELDGISCEDRARTPDRGQHGRRGRRLGDPRRGRTDHRAAATR